MIIASDNPSRGEEAVRKIIDQTGNREIYYHFVDLTDFQSVRALVDHINKVEQKLNVLINAAEIVFTRETKTMYFPNKPDDVFIHNHLGPFLLTYLLLKTLKTSIPSRIINVASTIHGAAYTGDPFLGLDSEEKRGKVLRGHKISKMANVLHVKELARKLAGTDVTANLVHTGAVGEHLLMPLKEYLPDCMLTPIRWFIWPVTLDYRAGAQTIIYCAVEKGLEHTTGGFFHDCYKVKESNRSKTVNKYSEILWDLSLEMCGLEQTTSDSRDAMLLHEEEIKVHPKKNGVKQALINGQVNHMSLMNVQSYT